MKDQRRTKMIRVFKASIRPVTTTDINVSVRVDSSLSREEQIEFVEKEIKKAVEELTIPMVLVGYQLIGLEIENES